jgi:hypothetical protein
VVVAGTADTDAVADAFCVVEIRWPRWVAANAGTARRRKTAVTESTNTTDRRLTARDRPPVTC